MTYQQAESVVYAVLAVWEDGNADRTVSEIAEGLTALRDDQRSPSGWLEFLAAAGHDDEAAAAILADLLAVFGPGA
jgi:hypothetical protein